MVRANKFATDGLGCATDRPKAGRLEMSFYEAPGAFLNWWIGFSENASPVRTIGK